MIQNDNPTAFVVTLDLSDMQADLPLFGACTTNMGEEITLVDPNTLAPAEKEISTEQVLFSQDIVYVQEEQVETQEVPQNEIIIENTETIQTSVPSNPEETILYSAQSSQEDQVIEIELPQGEEDEQNTEDEANDEDMSFISDDLASLLSEDLDGDLERAAKDALNQKSLRPIINEELKTIIQHRRVRGGKCELKLEETTRKRSASFEEEELTEETVERKKRRRERNKLAAQKCRNRKRERADELEEETDKLMARQEQMKDEVESLRQEKELLLTMLRFHDASPAAKCGRTLRDSEKKSAH